MLFTKTKQNNLCICLHQQCNEITYIENVSSGKHCTSCQDFSYTDFQCIIFFQYVNIYYNVDQKKLIIIIMNISVPGDVKIIVWTDGNMQI